MRKFVLSSISVASFWLGAGALTATALGAGLSLWGVSANAVIEIGRVLQPHEARIEKAAGYGSKIALFGINGLSLAILLAFIMNQLQNDEAQIEEEQDIQSDRCHGCIYYSSNGYLACAVQVQPLTPKDCKDYQITNDKQ